MDAIDCIKTRMSIRKFSHEPVPQELLVRVIDAARWSPSYKNSQPWEVAIVSGQKKAGLTKMLLDLLESGAEPTPDMPEPRSWPPQIEERIASLLKKRGEAFGVDLNSPDMRKKSKAANFRFYGAPHAVYLYQDASLNEWSIFDIGLFAENLMLAAWACGLGTVPQAFVTDYSLQIKEFLGISSSKRLVLGISIGYPDLEAPINKFRTDRVDVTDVVHFME